MNKRDFLKGSAALTTVPALFPMIGNAATTVADRGLAVTASIPTPSYVYDSTRRAMTFYRMDRDSQAMHAYFAHG